MAKKKPIRDRFRQLANKVNAGSKLTKKEEDEMRVLFEARQKELEREIAEKVKPDAAYDRMMKKLGADE